MLKLYASKITPLSLLPSHLETVQIVRLTEQLRMPAVLRPKEVLLIRQLPSEPVPEGFKAYFILPEAASDPLVYAHLRDAYLLPETLAYLQTEDVVRFDASRGSLRVLYRRQSVHNSILVTERCNNYCLMCSQPPKQADDSFLVQEILKTLPLMSPETPELGITGGEPTLLGEDLLRIVRTCKTQLPQTSLHILSNGRAFRDLNYTQQLAQIDHPDLMLGIPLYSDLAHIHNYVVQADGAYDETIKGILNLKRYRQRVEVRVVIHQQTYARLPQLAAFLARNLLMVDHVALMGLEMTGFTRANLDALWIDPVDYQQQLYEACMILARYRMHFSIYNHQLCLLDPRLHRYAVKSISDWKNEYMPECAGCSQQEQCGGFFSSATYKYSRAITAFAV